MPRATNSALMRRKNEKIILSLINRAPISRADIAKETGLTKAAVTIIADELLQRGIIAEEKAEETGIGRTPYLLRLVPSSAYFIGVYVRRVGITVGICDLSGRTVCERELPIEEPRLAFGSIADAVKDMIDTAKIPRKRLYKAAIATPGPVDSAEGRILNPPNFETWHGVNALEALKTSLGIEVTLGNVSSAAAVAEMYFGSARDSKSFLALIVDEGIGSGVVTGGRLFGGSCELGHVSIKHNGRSCECGNRGCLEKYASIPNILEGTKHKCWRDCIESEDLQTLLLEAEYLSCAIVTASNIFDLDTAVICGELAGDYSDRFIRIVGEKTVSRMLKKRDFTVLASSVGSRSLTAAALAVYDFFNA